MKEKRQWGKWFWSKANQPSEGSLNAYINQSENQDEGFFDPTILGGRAK